MMAAEQRETLQRFQEGDTRTLARLLTRIENGDQTVLPLLDELFDQTGSAWRLGVTGPPGAGKSTLVNQLVLHYRKLEQSVGVIAFDPTSPFSGGALLGDRVRMDQISRDQHVFIRSMATRGHLGGLAVSVDEACDLLDAYGKQRVILETVGVGQSELEVAHAADTTVVTLVPQSGDAVQALKAGLMEIADVFVLNKCDRDGADRAYQDLVSTLELKESEFGWNAPVVRTVAEKGDGVAELAEAIEGHRLHLKNTGRLAQKRRDRRTAMIRRLVKSQVDEQLWRGRRDELARRHDPAVTSPYVVAQQIVDDFFEEIRHG